MSNSSTLVLETTTVQFSIQLGESLSINSGQIRVYPITENGPQTAGTPTQISSNTGNIELPIDQAYCYAILEINEIDNQSVDGSLQLLSIFPINTQTIVFSEPVTVANTFCFAQLATVNSSGGIQINATDRQCMIASKMRNNFVGLDGTISEVIQASPNGKETNSFAMFNSLSNLVYYGITDADVYDGLGSITNQNNLLGSLLNIAQHPFDNVANIYSLIAQHPSVYSDALPDLDLSNVPHQPSPIPDQWTLTIKVNNSGSENFLIGGPGYIVFDKNDRAWISNNVRQGTLNSSTWCLVLEPDGRPAPFSPLFGNDLLGGAFGMTTNADGSEIYIGNFGWGPKEYLPEFGSISIFESNGRAVSLPPSFKKDITRPQGMAFDGDGNLWACSWGSQESLPDVGQDSVFSYNNRESAIVCFLKDHNWDAVRYVLHDLKDLPSPNHRPFDLVIDLDNNVFLTAGGYKDFKGNARDIKSSIWKFALDTTGDTPFIQNLKTYRSNKFESYKQIILNSAGELLIAGQSSDRVLKLSSDLEQLGTYTSNIFSPWAICEDAANTLFIANFYYDNPFGEVVLNGEPKEGQLKNTEALFRFGVTVIPNGDDSQSKLMTLPSGGDEVRLANGKPLYGNVQPKPCYQPLMRMTCNVPDKAGNLWVTNNWKPGMVNDITKNPSGDGIVIFVGVAKPAA